MAASKQANIHTHMRNAVPLVWGSLRLAPIILSASFAIIGNIKMGHKLSSPITTNKTITMKQYPFVIEHYCSNNHTPHSDTLLWYVSKLN